MITKFIIFICLYLSISHILISSDNPNNDIIKLNVGGKLFETRRSTLTAYPESMLGVMFNINSPYGAPNETMDGYIFLDENPKYFKYLLNFLRDGIINIVDIDMARSIRPFSDRLCPPMCDMVDDFISSHSQKLKLIQVPEKKRVKWHLARTDNDMIIGRKSFDSLIEAQFFLNQYLHHQTNKDLCFSRRCDCESNKIHAIAIFNVNNNQQIGEAFKFGPNTYDSSGDNSSDEENLWNTDNAFPIPDPIEEAIKINDVDYYVCSSAGNKFAIFNAISGKKIRPEEEYETWLECTETLKRYVNEKILPENLY